VGIELSATDSPLQEGALIASVQPNMHRPHHLLPSTLSHNCLTVQLHFLPGSLEKQDCGVTLLYKAQKFEVKARNRKENGLENKGHLGFSLQNW
jgi:hypothetical protein